MALLLSGGHVCDPGTGFDGVADVLVDGGTVVAVGTGPRRRPGESRVIARFRRDLPEMVADLEEPVGCESPSADPAALARSAAVTGAQGARQHSP